jgi:hypothetical protein
VDNEQFNQAPAQPKPPKAKRAHSTFWKVRLIALFVGLGWACLAANWKTVDKYFPQLNQVLHAGTPTSEDDVQYLMGHLNEDLKTLGDPCTEDMTFRQCRARIIANKPVVEDLNLRVTKLDEAWTTELKENTVPQSCQAEMGKTLTAYKYFVQTENSEVSMLESMNTDEAEKNLMQRYNGISGEDDAAWGVIRDMRKTDACKGY